MDYPTATDLPPYSPWRPGVHLLEEGMRGVLSEILLIGYRKGVPLKGYRVDEKCVLKVYDDGRKTQDAAVQESVVSHDTGDRYVGKKEAAEIAGASTGSIINWYNAGRIRGQKVPMSGGRGYKLEFLREDVEKMKGRDGASKKPEITVVKPNFPRRNLDDYKWPVIN